MLQQSLACVQLHEGQGLLLLERKLQVPVHVWLTGAVVQARATDRGTGAGFSDDEIAMQVCLSRIMHPCMACHTSDTLNHHSLQPGFHAVGLKP